MTASTVSTGAFSGTRTEKRVSNCAHLIGVVMTGLSANVQVKLSRMRQRIAERLKEAQNVNAMLTTFNEIDMRYHVIVSVVKLLITR